MLFIFFELKNAVERKSEDLAELLRLLKMNDDLNSYLGNEKLQILEKNIDREVKKLLKTDNINTGFHRILECIGLNELLGKDEQIKLIIENREKILSDYNRVKNHSSSIRTEPYSKNDSYSESFFDKVVCFFKSVWKLICRLFKNYDNSGTPQFKLSDIDGMEKLILILEKIHKIKKSV